MMINGGHICHMGRGGGAGSVVRTNNTINPYAAGGHFCLYILMMQKFRKMIEILANGYSCESTY